MVTIGEWRDTWLRLVGGVTHGYVWWMAWHTVTSGWWRDTWLLVVICVTQW